MPEKHSDLHTLHHPSGLVYYTIHQGIYYTNHQGIYYTIHHGMAQYIRQAQRPAYITLSISARHSIYVDDSSGEVSRGKKMALLGTDPES